MKIIVIGSGFGGLAAAVRLVRHGHEVTLLEQRDGPGGRAYVYRQDGFTFDGGPTVITAPWMFRDLFATGGRNPDDYMNLVPVDPFYRIFFSDGVAFNYSADAEAMEQGFRELGATAQDITGYRDFAALSSRIFDKGFTELADRPFLKFTDMLKVVPDLVKLQSYRSVTGLLGRYVQDEKMRQILSFHPLLVGGNPFQTTSIYTLIHHLERQWGVWYAMGGTGALVDSLVCLFRELGGHLHLSTTVDEIIVEDGRATGVRLADGRSLAADVVVCNAEVAGAYTRLLPASIRRKNNARRIARMRYSMSLVVIYFGTDRLYRDGSSRLAHHNIILGPRYKELLSDIFTRKHLANDFSLYLHMPTLTDPSLAPEGCESFYVLAPVPHLGGATDWETAARPYRDRIMAFLEEHYLPDLSSHVVTEHMIDPRHFGSTLSSYLGSAFSVEPVLTQSAWFRPHNRSEDVPNLYFVGAGTHPGAGLPGVLSSAVIAENLIQNP